MENRLHAIGTVTLLVAATLVGIAIVLDGDAGSIVNGVGGLLWFGATAILVVAGAKSRPAPWLWVLLVGVTLIVAFVIKPSAMVPTLIGFIPAGFVMATMAARSKLLWAALVPACYLPAHIGTAVVRSVAREMLGNDPPLRTDPPPTAAMVPFLMVVCALIGGLLAVRAFGGRLQFSDRWVRSSDSGL